MDPILVVEDDEGVRDVISEMLTGWGYESVLAENGEIGLEKFRSNSFSLILTDIRMPVKDGLSMLKTIRLEDKTIPIIVLTGFPTVDSAVESLVEGADYYLVKPINMEDLKAKISKSFEKRIMFNKLSIQKRRNLIHLILIPVWIVLGYLITLVLR